MTKKIEVFASEALPGELEDFPDIKRGWGTTKEITGGIPPMKWFNAIQKRTDEAINAIAEGSISGHTFKDGATLDSHNDLIYDDVSKSWYFWIGGSGKVIPPDSNASEIIETDGGIWSDTNPDGLWVNVGDASLRGELLAVDGQSLIGSADYDGVRSYTGSNSKISVYGISHISDGAGGVFYRDDADSITPDDNGTVLVDALNRRWKRLISDNNVDVKWFGAKCNGVDDDTLPLQRAIDAAKRLGNHAVTVYGHKTTLPIIIYTKTKLTSKVGGMINKTVASKLSSPPKPTLSPTGDGSDSYDKDATIIVYHDDERWATSWSIDNVAVSNIEGSDSYENYCIYAPRAHTFKLENVALYKALHGIAGHNWFMFEFKKLYSYFSSTRKAIILLPSTTGYHAATTGFITNFWSNDGGGISLTNAVDITLVSPAFEKMQTGAMYIESSQVNIIGIDTERVSASTSTLFITKGSVVNINGWDNYNDGSATVQAHLWVQGGSAVVVTAAKVSNTGNKVAYGITCRENSRVTLIESKIEGNNGHQCTSGGEIVMQSGARRTVQTEHGKSQTPVSGTVLQLEAGGFIDTTLRGELTGVMVFVTNSTSVRAAVKEITQGYIKVHFYNTTDGTENFGKYDVSWIASLKNPL